MQIAIEATAGLGSKARRFVPFAAEDVLHTGEGSSALATLTSERRHAGRECRKVKELGWPKFGLGCPRPVLLLQCRSLGDSAAARGPA